MTTKKYNFPKELLTAIEKENLIVFVGAGLSYNLKNEKGETIGGWGKLVEQILIDLKEKGHDVDHFLGLIGKCEPIKVLDLIESDSKLPKSTMIEFTKDFLELHEDNDYSLHENIFKLSRKIITTNYDEAFETAVKELKRNTAFKGKTYELTKHKEIGKPSLFKLHGCLSDGHSMVLFPSKYRDLYNNPKDDAEHALLVLKNIIVNKTVLFIGCGMGDYQINSLFSYVKKLQKEYNQKHFIITKDTPDSSLDFLEAITIEDYNEITEVIEQLLKEKELFVNQKTPEEEELEKQIDETEQKLIESNKKIDTIKQKLSDSKEEINKIKNENELKDALLKREALKYFSRGLEFQKEEKYEKACDEYKSSSELFKNQSVTFYNWGSCIFNLAKKDNKEDYYINAIEKFKIAARIDPKATDTLLYWGNILSELGSLKNEDRYYAESCEKYEIASQIKPKSYKILNNWGVALNNLGKLTNDQKYFLEAYEKYEIASQIEPKSYKSFSNWGDTLYSLGKLTKEKKYYIEASEKYKKATQINPEHSNAFINWTVSILYLYYLTQEKKLLNEALEKAKKAYELGDNSYNLACVYSLKEEKEEALMYLEICLKEKQVSIGHVDKDIDWENYRDVPDFIALLDKYRD